MSNGVGVNGVNNHHDVDKKHKLNGASDVHFLPSAVPKTKICNSNSRVADETEKRLSSIRETVEFLNSRTKSRPVIAIICGTGFGCVADCLKNREIIDYLDIPNFVPCTVPGHAGQLVFGSVGGVSVVCLQGRPHAYEAHTMWQLTFPVRVMAELGVKIVIATNACGALNDKYKVGDLMIMKDHINLPGLTGLNPLVGVFDDRFGTRFPCLNGAYERRLRVLAWRVGRRIGLADCLHEGVYLVQCGPSYESPAELRMVRTLGADVVGMSTAPEVIVARQCGVMCFGLSLVSNLCILDDDDASAEVDDDGGETAGNGDALDGIPVTQSSDDSLASTGANHDEVLDAGHQRAEHIKSFLSEFVTEIGRNHFQ